MPQIFFEEIKTFKLTPAQKLLVIYLRGLCARFRAAVFYWKDTKTAADLGINHKALQRSRAALQRKGLIQYASGKGRFHTAYKIINIGLLPTGLDKKTIPYGQRRTGRVDRVSTPYKSNHFRVSNILKNVQVFQGMTEEERRHLKTLGIL